MKALTMMGTLAAVLALTACGRSDEAGVAQGRDAAAERAEQRAEGGAREEAGRDAAGSVSNAPRDAAPSVPGHQDAVVTGTPQPERAAERAGERTEDAARSAGDRAAEGTKDAVDATARGVDRAADAVSDAAITASVNAELARDSELSALGINVDTENSHVTLRGTAPNQAALDRATELARKVRGVKEVDNELRVESR